MSPARERTNLATPRTLRPREGPQAEEQGPQLQNVAIMESDGLAAKDAHVFIAALDEVDLTRFRVVGAYTRYDESVRNALQDAQQKILAGFEPHGRKRENHLVWAAPGSGKTYFVQQVATSLPPGTRYHELNLAKCTEPEFRSGLGALDRNEACLCLVDEVDAKPQDPWPYEVLLPYLDAAVDRDARFVFVLAGSSGSSLDEIKQRIAARPKGADLLSRIPTGYEYEIRPMTLGDRILIVLSQLRQAGWEAGREIRAVEKLGLYYVALNPRLANARQLREFAVRAVERVPKSDDRVKYDHLFIPGDPENKAFWVQALPGAEHLVNTFVTLARDYVESALPRGSLIGPSAAPSGAPIVAIGTRPNTNLLRQLTSFIGREREMAEVKRLLSTTPLLTLTGTGGCGKTRLALQVAADLLGEYSDGVWLADLAALFDPTLVPKTVASALGVPEQPGQSLTETLVDRLRSKSLLLVLDNCEHLVGACAELGDVLLRSCSNLRILATCREPFGVPGETLWQVPSLSVPDPRRQPPPEHLAQYEAIRLFVERAASNQPGFAVTERNATAVANVCTQLDGIPLAIELAAARVKGLTAEQIAARLDDRFRLLAKGSRTALPRHQTLRAALDWSYDLLLEKERAALRRLSVFAGGWTLEAAEAICSGEEIEATDILDLLTQLVDKSLVVAETQGGQGRYRLLQTIRQYSRDRLLEAGEADIVRRCHRDWYLRLAEQAETHLNGSAQGVWLERLEVEHDNLRAALEWGMSEEDAGEFGLRLAVALRVFWEKHGHFTEGRRWLEGFLARSKAPSPLLKTTALNGAGILAYRQGDYGQVSMLCTEALTLSEESGDKRGAAQSLHFLAHLQQARADYASASEMMERSVTLYQEAGDTGGTANSVDCLGEIARSRGDYDSAAILAEEALTLYSRIGDIRGKAHALHNIAYITLRRGHPGRARALFRQSLNLAREIANKRDIVFALAGLAGASVGDMEPTWVARLFGAVEALLGGMEIHLEPAEDAEFVRNLAVVRARLNVESFATVWAEGQAITLEQAIEYALAEN